MDYRIALDDEQMKALMAKSIVDSLTPEARTSLIQNAIAKLMQPDAYSKKNPVQEAFDFAVQAVARKIADEMLENDPKFQEQVKGLFVDVAAKMFAADRREKLVDDLAERVRRGLLGERY